MSGNSEENEKGVKTDGIKYEWKEIMIKGRNGRMK